MVILRHFSAITTPVVAGYHPDIEGGQQCQQFTAGFISSRAEGVGQLEYRAALTAAETALVLRVLTMSINQVRVHHDGLRDKVTKNGPTVKYERRQLLGFTDGDSEWIGDLALEWLAN